MPEKQGLGLIDYALAALLRLGGDITMVDIEDVTVEAYRLAPDRYRWRRHDYPNLELVRVMVSAANRGGAHIVLRDESGKERMLSVEGLARAKAALAQIEGRGGDMVTVIRRKDSQEPAELARMEGHPAYHRWRQAGISSVDAVDLADIARCSASTPVNVFSERLRRFQTVAAHWHRDELARFLGEAAKRLPALVSEENR